MTWQGRVQNGVVVLTSGTPLPDGTVVNVVPTEAIAGPCLPVAGQKPPYPVSQEQREALLGLIGMWKIEQPPSDEEVERMMDEYRMKKYA
jgi:hypothetical protein